MTESIPQSLASRPGGFKPALAVIDGSDIAVSFEFFPPKTAAMEAQLWQAVETLAPIRPAFMSVTYGAGGSTRERTHAVVTRIQAEIGIPAAAHLTCVNATRDEIDEIASAYWAAGIRHIVALRGDPPGGIGGSYTPAPNGYAYANELVAGLLALHPFDISVAAYPECHPQAQSPAQDLDALKRKIDAGAKRAITQFFFDAADYARFRERAEKLGVAVPIVPGILPLTNFTRAAEMAKSCGARIPSELRSRFDGLDDNPAARYAVAAAIAAEQCRDLYALGVRQFHFYTLNRADLVLGICQQLGVVAVDSLAPTGRGWGPATGWQGEGAHASAGVSGIAQAAPPPHPPAAKPAGASLSPVGRGT